MPFTGAVERFDKRLIDFDRINIETLQLRQGRIPRAKIINIELDPHLPKQLQFLEYHRITAHHR